MGRKQFTFYRSYYEAVKDLNKRDQTAVLLAICDYALNETEPNLTGAPKAIFTLIRPTLDSARRKAEGGMAKGKDEEGGKTGESRQQDCGKIPQRYDEDAANKKEGEKENEKKKENEYEIEGEEEKEDAPHCDGRYFTEFWDAYPNKLNRDKAWEAWKKLNPTEDMVKIIMESLSAWKTTSQWEEDRGRYIPGGERFLTDEGYWKYRPLRPGERPLGEYEIAAIRRMMAEG